MCFFFLVCLIIVCYSYKEFHSIFHPAFITSIVWLIILFCYNVLDHGLYSISNNVYWALLLWIFTFCGSSLLLSKAKISLPPFLYYKRPNSIYLSSSLFLFYVAVLSLLIYMQYKIGLSETAENGLEGMRLALTEESASLPASYLLLARVEVFIYVLFWGNLFFINYKVRSNRIKTIVLGLLILIFTFQLATKGKIIELFFAYLFLSIYTKRLNIKYFISGIFVVFFILYIVSLMREGKDELDLIELLTIYILSPITALNEGLNYKLFEPTLDGSFTFRFFYNIYDAICGGIRHEALSGNAVTGWIFVPLPTNVYTIVYQYYLDFGYYGIGFMGILMGTFWGVIYNLSHKGVHACALIYALLYYTLVFQFFGDWFFVMFSLTLQTICWSLFIFLRFRFTN